MGQINAYKPVGGVEVVFAALINDSKVTIFRSVGVGQDAVELVKLE